jgi:hypothetical protein
MKPAFAVPPRIISLPAALHSNSVKPVACRKASNHRATSLFSAQRASFRLAPSPISQRTQSFHALLIRPTGSCHSQFRACAGSFIAPAAATLSFLVHHRLFWVRIAAGVCVSFLVITSSAITTSKHLLSLSLLPLLHITSPPITSSYLEPRILPPFIPLLLLSSRRISFRPGIFATQIRHWPDTSLCTETRFWVVGIARNSVENCCGRHFFELHTSTTPPRTVQLFLPNAVGLGIR